MTTKTPTRPAKPDARDLYERVTEAQAAAVAPTRDVTVAYIHTGETVSYSWHHSLVQLLSYDGANSRRIADLAPMQAGVGMLGYARGEAVRQWLRGTAEWLLWVDTDMGFRPDTLDRLLAASDPRERPIVGGLCFAQRREVKDGMGGYRPVCWPTIFEEETVGRDREVGYWPIFDYPMDSLIEVAATGSAMLLVHRSVYQKTGDWYDPLQGANGRWLSEDLAFCTRVREAGIPIHVHTGIHTTHHKPTWVHQDDYLKETYFADLVEKTRAEVARKVMERDAQGRAKQ